MVRGNSRFGRRGAAGAAAALALLLACAVVAGAETVTADIDGDGMRDRVTATSRTSDGSVTVSVALGGADGRTLTRRFESAYTYEPLIELVADVDGRAGAELFLHRAHISTFDTTAILTVVDGRLRVAGSFPVNSGPADGYAMGFRCVRLAGRPAIAAYSFAEQPRGGRWLRTVRRHRWRAGRLVRVGDTSRSTVSRPPSAETGRGCPASPAPANGGEQGRATRRHRPPVVLGERDNGLFAGIGVAHPTTIHSAAGFESFVRLRWRGWGSRRAIATGRFVAPRTSPGHVFRVRLTASDRGDHADCDDGRAYRSLRIKLSGERAVDRVICQ